MDGDSYQGASGSPAPAQQGIAAATTSQLMAPTGIWSSCSSSTAACGAGMILGLVVAILIYLAYWFVYVRPAAERLTNLASQVYGPNAAQQAVLNGMRTGDPRISSIAKERMTPNMAKLWK